MSDSLNRRDFIKYTALSGIALATPTALNANMFLSSTDLPQISNDSFTVTFDVKNGRFNIYQTQGNLSIINSTVRANTLAGKRSISENSYEHSADHSNINDELGKGQQLIVNSKDLRSELNFEVRFALYENWSNLIIEVFCKNVSSKQLTFYSIEPICAIEEIGAKVQWSRFSKVLTNGAMYYDPGLIQELDLKYKEPEPYGPIKGVKLNPDFIYPSENRIRSWWNMGFFRGYDEESLVCGFVDNLNGLGQLIASKINSDAVSIYTESVFSPGFILKPGSKIGSNRFMINIDKDPYAALEKFSEVTGKINSARTNSIINGWCSWFYTYGDVTEDEVIRNAEFISQNLKQYGLEYVQIDEGFQKYHGDWEGNEKFPHGMKWLANKIKSYGLKPGLWLAPYVISELTEVFQKHPDWLLKDADEKLLRVGPWPSLNSDWAKNENPKRYGLDVTHPEAVKWLYNLFHTAANDWGYEMFKIDFVAWSLLSAHHFYERSVPPAQAYRKGMEIIRSAIGNERHINDCGSGNISVGLIDSMRIESDQNYGYAKAAWQQYFLESASSAPAAAKRYYFHGKTWVNDADHVCLNLLSIPQAQAAASLIALTGGNIISGDRLTDLASDRLDILKKILPSFGKAAKPVDLFDTDRQSVFALKIKKPFAEWTIVGFFNSSENEVIEKTFPLNRLWLDTKKIYLGYDFWKEKFIGEISETVHVKIFPSSVTLLSLHEKTGYPQFLSSDNHVLQGAHEIENVEWNLGANTLSGVSKGLTNSMQHLTIYSPKPLYWEQGGKALYNDFDNYSVKIIDDNLIRVKLIFKDLPNINWKIKFDENFE